MSKSLAEACCCEMAFMANDSCREINQGVNLISHVLTSRGKKRVTLKARKLSRLRTNMKICATPFVNPSILITRLALLVKRMVGECREKLKKAHSLRIIHFVLCQTTVNPPLTEGQG